MAQQSYAFLVVKPPDVGDNRLVVLAQPETIAQGIFVPVFFVKVADAVPVRDEMVDFRVPDLIIDTVEYPAELAFVEIVGCGSARTPDSGLLLPMRARVRRLS